MAGFGHSEEPPGASRSEITILLQRVAQGDQAAHDELAPVVLAELRRLAAFYLRAERPFNSWQTNELVNEAYLKLVGGPTPNFNGRAHFFGIASRIMRRLLIDYARRKRSRKRGGDVEIVPWLDGYEIPDRQCDMIAELDEALERLAAIDPQTAQVVELQFFGGCTREEIAVILDICPKTVNRQWMGARAWLHGQLRPGSSNGRH
jgi:RNA polymerase sigma factor (TIGR02999 family)